MTTLTETPLLQLEPPSQEALAAGRAAAEALIYDTDWTQPEPPVVDDVVAAPELATIVDISTAAPITTRSGGRVVTVYSPKGGAGTTFVAVNLAVALAHQQHRVCLVDLDLQFGDVAIMTRTSPVRGLVDAVGVELDDTALAGIVTTFNTAPGTPVDCVLAPVDPAAGESVTADVVGRLLRELRDRYDYVIVDTAARLSEQTLEALDAADRQVLVTTPDISSVKNTRLLLDTLDLIGSPAERRLVVVNQAGPKDRAAAGSVAEALQHEVLAALPLSPGVRTSADLGRPLVASTPKDPAAAALRAFVVAHVAPVAAAPTGRRFGRRSSRHSGPKDTVS